MDIWTWYLEGSNAANVAKLCARINCDPDENYGKAIDAMIQHGQHWIDTWDSNRSNINTYMLMRIGYSIRNKTENKERFLTDQESESLAYTNSEVTDEPTCDEKLLSVLVHLSGYDQWLITARHVYKLSFSLMGDRLGVRKGMVREHYIRAINRAKRYVP